MPAKDSKFDKSAPLPVVSTEHSVLDHAAPERTTKQAKQDDEIRYVAPQFDPNAMWAIYERQNRDSDEEMDQEGEESDADEGQELEGHCVETHFPPNDLNDRQDFYDELAEFMAEGEENSDEEQWDDALTSGLQVNASLSSAVTAKFMASTAIPSNNAINFLHQTQTSSTKNAVSKPHTLNEVPEKKQPAKRGRKEKVQEALTQDGNDVRIAGPATEAPKRWMRKKKTKEEKKEERARAQKGHEAGMSLYDAGHSIGASKTLDELNEKDSNAESVPTKARAKRKHREVGGLTYEGKRDTRPLPEEWAPASEDIIAEEDAEFGQYESRIVFETDNCDEEWGYYIYASTMNSASFDKLQWGEHTKQGEKKIRDNGQESRRRHKSTGVHMASNGGVPKRNSAVNKILSWWDYHGNRQKEKYSKAHCHVVLRMGTPSGPMGEAVLWADMLNGARFQTLIKNHMRRSHFTIVVAIPPCLFACLGQFRKYVDTLSALVTKFAGRISIQLMDKSIVNAKSTDYYNACDMQEDRRRSFDKDFSHCQRFVMDICRFHDHGLLPGQQTPLPLLPMEGSFEIPITLNDDEPHPTVPSEPVKPTLPPTSPYPRVGTLYSAYRPLQESLLNTPLTKGSLNSIRRAQMNRPGAAPTTTIDRSTRSTQSSLPALNRRVNTSAFARKLQRIQHNGLSEAQRMQKHFEMRKKLRDKALMEAIQQQRDQQQQSQALHAESASVGHHFQHDMLFGLPSASAEKRKRDTEDGVEEDVSVVKRKM